MATTFSNHSWTSGKHQVTLGNTLSRTLKARKGVAVDAKASKYSREFYSFRYNFKPESIDTTKAGTIEVRKLKDEAGPSGVSVVRPSTQNDHGVNYTGSETNAREFDCVLIYDEQTGSFTLEKLDSMVVLQHDPKTVRGPRYVGSPTPAAPPRVSTSSSSSSSAHAQPPEIAERQEEEESEGEIPEPKAKAPSRPSVPSGQSKGKQVAPARVPSPKASTVAPSPKPTPAPRPVARSAHALPVKPTPTTVSAKTKSKPPASPIPPSPAETKPGIKRQRPDEEPLETRRTAPPKKAKVAPAKKEAPPPKEPVSLAFPNSSSAVSFPPSLAAPTPPPVVQPPAPALTPTPAPAPPSAPAAAAATPLSDSEDDEEWDLVPSTIPSVPPAAPSPASEPDIEMEVIEFSLPSAPAPAPASAAHADEPEGEEIDMDAFEELLNDQLGNTGEAEQDGDDVDDFLAGAVSPVAERQPLSLNQFVGGGADFGDEDEYSSSDESDDD